MFNRNLYIGIFAVVVMLAGGSAATAQTVPVRGIVVMQQADGTKTPVAEAVILPVRTDISRGTGPTAKTNRRGEFNFAGFSVGTKYILAVSGPGISPILYPNVQPGMDSIEIIVTAGDGARFTEEQVRARMTEIATTPTATAPATSEEAKKAEAEYQKQLEEFNARKAKAEDTNKIVNAALKEGNAAYGSQNFDQAIASYMTGIKADPDFVGSAPVLMSNMGLSLNERARMTFNANAKQTDLAVRREGMNKVRADLGEAAGSFTKAWTMIANAKPGEIQDAKIAADQRRGALVGIRDTFRLMGQTEQVDLETLQAGKPLIDELIASESDKAKKGEVRLIWADAHRVAGDFDNALVYYNEILNEAPDNVDAMAGAGLTLVVIGYANEDNAKLQEAANMLQRYSEAAPAGHKFKDDVVPVIAELKKSNITPTKTPARRRN